MMGRTRFKTCALTEARKIGVQPHQVKSETPNLSKICIMVQHHIKIIEENLEKSYLPVL